MQRRQLLRAAGALPFAAAAAAPHAAESAKAITVYHPFEPSPYDVLSRVINNELAEELGVPVHFEYGLMGPPRASFRPTTPTARTSTSPRSAPWSSSPT